MANIILWNCFNEDYSISRPIGPHVLAHWLRQHGYTAKVIDFCHALTTQELIDISMKHIGPDTITIGASTTFWKPTEVSNRMHENFYDRTLEDFYEPAWVIKARENLESKFPSIDWILGGHAGVGRGSKQKRFSWTTFTSFAEDSLLKYMNEKSPAKVTPTLFDIKNLTACFYNDASIQPTESLPIELARGCQFKCKFCSYPLVGKKNDTYIRDEHHIYDEFIRNYEMFGTTRYAIMDDTVNENPKKIERLANIAQRLPFKLEWVGYNRLDIIGTNKHTIDLLKESGLKSTYFGIESFHPEASTTLGKGWNGKYGKEFLLELRERWGKSISITCSFIAGLPHETEESLDETQDWLVKHGVVDNWFFLQLFLTKGSPATEFERNSGEYGISFPDHSRIDYWKHDLSNFDMAIEKAKSLNYDQRRVEMVKPMTWYIPNYASIGYDYDTIMQTRFVDLPWKIMGYKFRYFVRRYVRMQLEE
jgi:hypothetical protein